MPTKWVNAGAAAKRAILRARLAAMPRQQLADANNQQPQSAEGEQRAKDRVDAHDVTEEIAAPTGLGGELIGAAVSVRFEVRTDSISRVGIVGGPADPEAASPGEATAAARALGDTGSAA